MPIRFVDRISRLGRISATLDALTATMLGDVTTPAARTGIITSQFAPLTASLTGFFTPAISRTGTIAATLDPLTATLTGTHTAIGLSWIGGNDTTTDVQATVGTPVDFDVAAQVVGEQSIALVSGSVPGLTYNPGTMRITGTPTTANEPTGVNLVFDADDGQGAAGALADWNARISGPGVVWYHGFDSDAEVAAFRWTGGFSGGNDPLAVGSAGAGRVRRITSDGPRGACLEILRLAGTSEVGSHWWRPLSPIVGSGNGRGIDDPGASGAIAVQAYAATSGGSQISGWGDRGFYGHSFYHTGSVFDGAGYYLQMRVKMDPRRASAGMPTVGKLSFQTRCDLSLTTQEIVTYSGGLNSGNPGVNYFRMYGGGSSSPLEQKATNGDGGNQPNNADGVCALSTNPNTCWAWSGGWDTVLYHVIPGRAGVAESRIEVYAAHEGETSYTKIWDMFWANEYGSGNPFGYNALILSTYNNGNNCPSEFWHRYADVIFSTQTIPCPQA